LPAQNRTNSPESILRERKAIEKGMDPLPFVGGEELKRKRERRKPGLLGKGKREVRKQRQSESPVEGEKRKIASNPWKAGKGQG